MGLFAVWFESEGNLEVRENRLFFAGLEVSKLADDYGTPIYVYNLDEVSSNYKLVSAAFREAGKPSVRIHYAMKANANTDILKTLLKEGAYIDAVSPQEVKHALAVGFPKEKILFTGTSVSNADLLQLAGTGVTINIDSFSQMRRLAKMKVPNKKISIRWNPSEGAGLHEHVITAGKYIKFGIPEKMVLMAFQEARALGFEVIGLHQHIGSGWLGKAVDTFLKTVGKTLDVAKKAEQILGRKLEFVDFGGGPGIPYSGKDKEFPFGRYARGIVSAFKKSGLSCEIAVEPGRSIVGNAGILLAQVNTVEEKNVPVIGVDAGFNDLVRPTMYGAFHEIVLCENVGGKTRKKFLVAGNLCESGDVFNTSKKELRELPAPKEGEHIAILSAGAYGQSMASTYNMRPLPKEIVVSKGKARLSGK